MSNSVKKVSSPKVMEGVVLSDVANKTVSVMVTRTIVHPRLKKIIRTGKKYLAHDEESILKKGDFVKIQEVVPLSKLKKFKVINIMKKAG